MRVIKVGTRKSKLALTQTKQIISKLQEYKPNVSFELVPYTTKGDQLVHVSLQKIGGKGIFVKDIEQALLDKKVDIAVHSLKDVPAILAEGCSLGAISEREDVRDCILFRETYDSFQSLPKGSIVGTSSLRRQLQLQEKRPDLIFKPLRGNIDTRIQKLKSGEYTAIILAQAGLNRLGWSEREDLNMIPLSVETCLPAIAQAALGLECRKEDIEVLEMLKLVNDRDTQECVTIERQVLSLMNANCTFPIAAFAQKKGREYQLDVMLATSEGQCIYVRELSQDKTQLATRAVESLRKRGVVGIS